MPKTLSAFFYEAGQERQCESGATRRAFPHGYVELSQRMERDLKTFILSHIEEFQPFEMVAVCSDGGQSAVTRAVYGAFDEELSADVAGYKEAALPRASALRMQTVSAR